MGGNNKERPEHRVNAKTVPKNPDHACDLKQDNFEDYFGEQVC